MAQGDRIRLFWGLMVLVGLVALTACRQKVPAGLEGYTHLGGNSYYRLWQLGESAQQAHPGDYITVQLRYSTQDDSTFFEGGRRFLLEPSAFRGSIDECFACLAVGDSASFVLPADEFFGRTLSTTLPVFFDSGSMMRIDVRMLDIEDSASFAKQKEAFLHWIEDFREYEKVLLRQYLMRERISTQVVDSLYYLPVTPGTGDYPRNGDTLTIEFEGRFLDGKYFDSTIKRHEPFVFVLGQKWQVIDGLERAVRLMREGEHAIFILPSAVAFGEGGSSTGIVPPYTTVVFEVELVEIKRAI